MKNFLKIFLIALITGNAAWGQTYPSKRLTLNNNVHLDLRKVIEMPDSNFVVMGQYGGSAGPMGTASNYGHVSEISGSGNKIWQFTGRMNDSSYIAFTDIALLNGLIWVTGSTSFAGPHPGRIILSNFDSNGNLVQAYQYISSDTSTRLAATHIFPDSSSHLWILGSYEAFNPHRYGLYMMKVDMNGNILAQKFYLEANRLEWVITSQPAPGDGFMIGGMYGEFAQFDSSGNFISGMTTGNNYANTIWCYTLLTLPNGDRASFGVASYNGDYDIALRRMNSSGQELFTKRYPMPGNQDAGNIITTDDGGFIFCVNSNILSDSAMLVKTDGNGSIEWARKKNEPGYFHWVRAAAGGKFCVAGNYQFGLSLGLISIIDTSLMNQCFNSKLIADSSYSYSDSVETLNVEINAPVTRQSFAFSALTDFTVSDDCFLSGFESPVTKDKNVTVFPNPFAEYIHIEIPGDPDKIKTIGIRSITGVLVCTFPVLYPGKSHTILPGNLPAGAYVIYLESAPGIIIYRKLILKK